MCIRDRHETRLFSRVVEALSDQDIQLRLGFEGLVHGCRYRRHELFPPQVFRHAKLATGGGFRRKEVRPGLFDVVAHIECNDHQIEVGLRKLLLGDDQVL